MIGWCVAAPHSGQKGLFSPPVLPADPEQETLPAQPQATRTAQTKRHSKAFVIPRFALVRGSPFTVANFLWSSSRPQSSSVRGDPRHQDDGSQNNAAAATAAMAAAQPDRPALTPQFCFNTVFLRGARVVGRVAVGLCRRRTMQATANADADFLRASRAVDDTITQHLNALVTPSRAGFDPASTARRTTPRFPSSSSSSSAPPPQACQRFRDTVLFPAWHARDDVIQYCAGVADDAVAKDAAVAAEAAAAAAEAAEGSLGDDVSPRRAPPEVTERLDPYIKRRQYALVEPQAALLAAQLRQERGVETIVRARSWDVLQARCGGAAGAGGAGAPGWEGALEQWKTRKSA